MSKRDVKYDYSLPKHQKKIVLCLAKNQPMIMRQTNKLLRAESTSTNRAFHELEKKQMVTRIEQKPYRGQHFWKYWLSERGIAYALMNGSNPNTVRELTHFAVKNDSEKKILEIYFELRSISPEVAINLDRALLQVDNLEPREFLAELVGNMSRVFFLMNDAEEKKFRDILDKSTDLRDAWKDFLEKLKEFSRKERGKLGVED